MYTRHLLLVLGLLVATATANAQALDASPVRAEGHDEATRSVQRRQHLLTEDGGSRIDEERYGGETQSIHVQSKIGGPAYQVRPANSRDMHSRESGPGSAGKRTWKIADF